MMGLKAQLAYHGASSVRDLKAKLGTPHDSLRKLIQVSALHKAFRSLGGATGALGLPAGSVAFAADGTASRDYRGGRLRTMGGEQPPTWDYALRVKISCVGFRCNDESDEYSSSDEPYFIMSVIGPGVANTVMKGPYSVDDGDTINDVTVVCNDVVPNELVLSTVIRENDQGSPEQAKNLILDRAREIATVAGAAYAIASGDGGSGNAAPKWIDNTPALGTLAKWFTGIFGMGDDLVGSDSKVLFSTFDNTKPPTTADIGPVRDFRGNKYNYVTNEIGSADEGRYEVFYMIQLYNAPPPAFPS